MTIGTGQRILATDILKHANASGYLDLANSTSLTISSGAVTQVQNFHRIAGESGADDELDTITPASDVTDGYILIIRPATAIVLTVKHDTGNIRCPNNTDLYLDDTHDTAILVYDSNLSKWMAIGPMSRVLPGKSFIGDSLNAGMTTGLTINQGGADDEILALKSSDVAHGVTGLAETDTFASLLKETSSAGGLKIRALTEDKIGFFLDAVYTTDHTAKSVAANAGIYLKSSKADGTSIQSPGADANILVIADPDGAQFIFDQEGSAHANVEWTTFDAHNDAALLTGLELALLDPIKGAFGEFMDANRQRLQALKIVTFNEDGHHFVNFTRLSMLLTGAARQAATRIDALELEISNLKQMLLAVRRIPFLGNLLLGKG